MIDYRYLERLQHELFEIPEHFNKSFLINSLTDEPEKFVLHCMCYVDLRFYNENYVNISLSSDLKKVCIGQPQYVTLKTLPAKKR